MARLALLHSPLMGPLAWHAVAAELRARGHAVETPTWPRFASIDDGYYDALAKGAASRLWGRDEPLILVVHSGAGGLLGPVENYLSGVSGVIFVDAIMQHPGKSWFDAAPTGLRDSLRAGAYLGELPAWDQWWPPGALEKLLPDADLRTRLVDELESLPLAFFEEPAPSDIYMGPAAYLQLSGAYQGESEAAARYGWPVVRLPLHHLAMLTHVEAVAAAIEGLAQRLEPTDG